MSILVNTRNEEKVILAFLDSLAVEYKTDFEQEKISADFISEYNQLTDSADSEIEAGNFTSQ